MLERINTKHLSCNITPKTPFFLKKNLTQNCQVNGLLINCVDLTSRSCFDIEIGRSEKRGRGGWLLSLRVSFLAEKTGRKHILH